MGKLKYIWTFIKNLPEILSSFDERLLDLEEERDEREERTQELVKLLNPQMSSNFGNAEIKVFSGDESFSSNSFEEGGRCPDGCVYFNEATENLTAQRRCVKCGMPEEISWN